MSVGRLPLSDGDTAHRVAVVSVVHTPLDARIHYRQIRALVEAGWEVTQVAPWTAFGVVPPPGVVAVDVARASGRRRVRAIRDARRAIARLAPDVDLVVLHDPELLLAVPGIRGLPPIVWDVHEDTAAALIDKPWLPAPLRALARPLVRLLERGAERRHHLLLAEEGYRDRFRRRHPVVANHPVVPDTTPPPDDDRVVYLGRISRGRGWETIRSAARFLAGEVEVELIGQADAEIEAEVRAAADAGEVVWHGFVPNDEALTRVEGALAGLSLLRDEPNYRSSLPTKVVEYLARGVPPITTPLPRAVAIVERADAGVVVPFDDPEATAQAVRDLRADPDRRRAMAARGQEEIRREHSWQADAPRFVAQLEAWARRPR